MTNGVAHMFHAHPVHEQQQLQEACQGKHNNIHKHAQECLVFSFIACNENPNEPWKEARKNASTPGKVAQCVRLLFAINIGPLLVTRKVTIRCS